VHNSAIKNEDGGTSYRVLRNNDGADIGTTSTRCHWADVRPTPCRRRDADDVVWLYLGWRQNEFEIESGVTTDTCPAQSRKKLFI